LRRAVGRVPRVAMDRREQHGAAASVRRRPRVPLPVPATTRHVCARVATSSGDGSLMTTAPAAPGGTEHQPDLKQSRRKERLLTLLELRRLYLGMVHADACLKLPSPVYRARTAVQPVDGAGTGTAAGACLPDAVQHAGHGTEAGAAGGGGDTATDADGSMDEEERASAALEVVAAMSLTAEQLKTSLRALKGGFAHVLDPGDGDRAQARVREAAGELAVRLRERVAAELPLLPFGEPAQAQALIEQRSSWPSTLSIASQLGFATEEGAAPEKPPSAIERLERAEKAAEAFVQRRIKPALKRAREQEVGELLHNAGSYLKGLWTRLNGGRADAGGAQCGVAALSLPLPTSTARGSEVAISQLGLELDSLEKRLQDASKARETKLRKAGLPGRVQMAVQLRGLDADVALLSQLLAVRTLQLEMEFIYRSLEDEALDMSGPPPADVSASALRDGDASELALLVADFVTLDEQLAALADALSSAGSIGNGAAAGGSNGVRVGGVGGAELKSASRSLSLIGEELLEKLAGEIPDMRMRVGVMDQVVFGGPGFSVTRLQLQGADALDKVREAVDFMVCGVRLLGSDLNNAGRLFMRAALGGTLKPREVSSLRRTARDVLTFIPFTIILIIPISPLGHVLVFSLIQTYFPSFFPSCFTKQRQEIMAKYDALQRQLLEAKQRQEHAEEEAELARAAAELARLTAHDSGGGNDEPDTLGASSSSEGESAEAAASGAVAAVGGHDAAVRALEEELSEVLQNVNLGDAGDDAGDVRGGGRRGAARGRGSRPV